MQKKSISVHDNGKIDYICSKVTACELLVTLYEEYKYLCINYFPFDDQLWPVWWQYDLL